ncbi:MAG TPA: hypothetical protein VF796_16010 [Humisphaera sp.]
MCSIFGFVASPRGSLDLSVVRAVVAANIRRGPHAFGFAWLDGRGRLRSYRQVGRLTDELPVLRMVADARLLIGHLRWATQGDPGANINNHPHPCDGGWLVHNGIVTNYDELLAGHRGLPVSSECDSELIGALAEASPRRTLAGRLRWSVDRVAGPLAVLGLWSRPGVLAVARRGNPLHWSADADGTYLATLAEGLPGSPRAVADGRLTILRPRGGATEATHYDLAGPPAAARFAAFDREGGGLYRGG